MWVSNNETNENEGEAARSVALAHGFDSRSTADPRDRAAEPQATAEREAEGLATFPCQKDITVGPYRVLVAKDTGEATIVYAPGRSSESSWVSFDDGIDYLVDGDGAILQKRSTVAENDRKLKNLDRANRRAVAKLRRYCIKNRLLKMLTLTYADAQWDRATVKDDLNALFIRWRSLKGGKTFPYVYVLEVHPGALQTDGSRGPSHGLHVHVAVPLHYVDKHWLQQTWGHGIVHFKDPKLLRDGTKRQRSSRLAHYLAKYIAKDLEIDHEMGMHRYEVAQGFEVEIERQSFATLEEAVEWLRSYKGEDFKETWSYREDVDWEAPPVWLFRSLESGKEVNYD